ncbi:sensor domain-containing diguanylate cyclase [Sulfuricurvum sp.]|uniref:sensor domain-containing protein n=1 Tax=Sulfuricurvum sp. TaxID=2025608 RepID=UPI00260FD383|nr:sensor domain-containing diguanylate cyclase [Sulfuricurvum sp.]MDD2781597.1 sensor domain-containing diguanylate cyclase [Sulfuricurvum sp.]
MELLAIISLIIVLSLWVVHSIFLNRRLFQSQSRYQQFFNDSPVVHIVIDKHHKIIEWNETAEIIFGWKHDEALGEDIIHFLVPEFDKVHVQSILNKAALQGLSHSKNYNITHQEKEIFCEWRNRRLEGTDGEILCMAQDITVSQKTLDDLHKRSTALEGAGDAIFYTNEKGFIEFANRSFFFLSISDPDTVYGNHIGTFLFEDRFAFSTLKSQFNAKQTWKGKINKSFNGRNKVLSVTITAIYHHNRLVSYIANLHDITALSSHVDALTYRAQYDQLTGALNRSTMKDRLSHAISRSERTKHKIALYFIDLNDFKQINDQYGHEAGDILLRHISKNLQSCLRNTDTVCRYGGDEFIVIIEDIKGENHLETIFDTIQTAIAEPIKIEDETLIYPSASVGMALYPDDATDEESLIRSADTAMYVAKKDKYLIVPEPKLSADNHNH